MTDRTDNSQPTLSPCRPLAVGIDEACQLLSIGKTKFYQLIGDGRIQVARIDKRSLIRVADLEQFLANAVQEQERRQLHRATKKSEQKS